MLRNILRSLHYLSNDELFSVLSTSLNEIEIRNMVEGTHMSKSVKSKENTFDYTDINLFNTQIISKSKNDEHNNKREKIIYSIIKNEIPELWYENEEWNTLKMELNRFITELNNNQVYNSLEIEHKGGRSYNYDYHLVFNNKEMKNEVNLEFKFNCNSITKYPEFLSLASKCITKNKDYAEYFYENYLQKILDLYEMKTGKKCELPSCESYLKYVYNSNYDKLPCFRYLYDNEDIHNLNTLKSELVNESIANYLDTVEINMDELNSRLQNQINKIFMMYKDGKFYKDKISEDELFVTNIKEIKNKNSIVCQTKNNNSEIHMLLRWKNHKGILYPAWQMSLIRNA